MTHSKEKLVEFCDNCGHPKEMALKDCPIHCPCHQPQEESHCEKCFVGLFNAFEECSNPQCECHGKQEESLGEWQQKWEESLKNRMRMNNDALLRNEIPWIEEFIKDTLAHQKQELIAKLQEMVDNTDPNSNPKSIFAAFIEAIKQHE